MTAAQEGRLTTADLAGSHAADAPIGRDTAAGESTDAQETEASTGGSRDERLEERESLLETGDSDAMRREWEAIQVGFVDDPRASVERADALVADVMRRLAVVFAEARAGLEAQWDRGDEVSTEDLRVALTRYRSFFERLLSA